MKRIPDQVRWRLWDLKYEETGDVLAPYTSGHQSCPPGHRDEMLLHYHLICCVQSGNCTFYTGSLAERAKVRSYTVGPGESFLIRPGQIASYVAGTDAPWVNAWIGFRGDQAEHCLSMTDFARDPVIKTGSAMYETIRTLTETALGLEDAAVRRVYASAALWKIFAELIQTSRFREEKAKRNPYTQRAVSLIQQRYSTSCRVSDIAAELCISREYLYTLFKNDTGRSPSQYLMDFRLERACTLLETSSYPVYLIAQYTGFSSETYFSRKFRDRMGMSPGAYRKKAKSGL